MGDAATLRLLSCVELDGGNLGQQGIQRWCGFAQPDLSPANCFVLRIGTPRIHSLHVPGPGDEWLITSMPGDERCLVI